MVRLADTVRVEHRGLDVVRPLLDYAAGKCPPHNRFPLNTRLRLPVATCSVAWFAAVSVFPHLLHTETYLYLEDMHGALRPGGRVLASFLEFAAYPHWTVFRVTLEQQRGSSVAHLN